MTDNATPNNTEAVPTKTLGNCRLRIPCIGVCSTVFGDRVCRGCKRFAFEIIGWNRYSDDQQAAVLKRLHDFRARVLQEMLEIVDADALHKQAEARGLWDTLKKTDLEIAHDLLCKAASNIDCLLDCGFQARLPEFQGTAADLLGCIEDKFYALSRAHYQRYFSLLADQSTLALK